MSYKIKTNKLPRSEAEIEVELEATELDKAKVKAVEHLSKHLDMAGFRKGKVPEKMILEKAGEARILEEAAEIAINNNIKGILEESKLDIIGRPAVSISKLAFSNPLVFKLKVSLMPKFKLPDYMKIAEEAKSKSSKNPVDLEVTEKELDEVLLQIRKNKAHYDWHRANPKEQDHSGHPDFDKEENLPMLDDVLARSAGNFKNLAEMKDKIKENIKADKQAKEVEKNRVALMEKLISSTEIELPEILVESETNKALAQMKDDVERVGSKFEEYLKNIKKTEEDLKEDLRKSSENKAKIQLIFNKIAEQEKLEPNKEILENEVKKILEMYPEAQEHNARIYTTTMLLNSEVLKLLEK